MGWKGRMGGGISYEETRNAKWRRLELWWPLSSSDKLTATPSGTFFPSPFYICPIHSCNIPSTTTTTLFCHSTRREAIIIVVAAAGRRSWKPKVICPSIFSFCACGLSVLLTKQPGPQLSKGKSGNYNERWGGCVYTGVMRILCDNWALTEAVSKDPLKNKSPFQQSHLELQWIHQTDLETFTIAQVSVDFSTQIVTVFSGFHVSS